MIVEFYYNGRFIGDRSVANLNLVKIFRKAKNCKKKSEIEITFHIRHFKAIENLMSDCNLNKDAVLQYCDCVRDFIWEFVECKVSNDIFNIHLANNKLIVSMV